MKKITLFLLIPFLFIGTFSNAQTASHRCGTVEYNAALEAADPSITIRRQQLENWTQQWIAANPDAANSKAVITIPVVFHVVYKLASQNISDAVIQEQMVILNRDFGGSSPHSMGGFANSLKVNTNIQFCLAQRKPDGTATNGIERVTTNTTSFSQNDGVKQASTGAVAWDVTKYFNIWVCNLGGGLLGYAQFPSSGINSTYGVVLLYSCVGVTGAMAPYNGGASATHEIGHCFNLFHIWGDDGGACSGSDNCADTPNQAAENYTPPAVGSVKTDACSPSSPGVMYMNYMDYTDDIAMANFTPNQNTRIQALFAGGGALNSLTTSNGCVPPTGAVVATVTTTTASAILSTSATSGGNVTADGGAAVTARGVCWSTAVNPTIALTTKTVNGTGTGVFTSSITGLTANTLYHVRAYATNSVGTAYGTDLTFTTTAAATIPVISTTAASAITQTTATSGGNVTADGGAAVSVRGVCWSTTVNPSIALTTKTANGTGTGVFTSSITGLTANTLYHVRAYATNSVGTAYGSDLTFTTTAAATIPAITTTTASAITQTTATSGGNVTADGGAAITVRGVCWSTITNPTIALTTKTADGTGTGVFTSSITGLTANTLYHVRAYATNSVGTAYGSDLTFTTTALQLPTLTTTAASAITATTATSGGNISADGGAAISVRGVCWSTNNNPTIALATKTADGTGTGIFTSSLTGLSAGTLYHIRAYATNSVGTSYGTDLTFTTLVQPPTVTTTTASAITMTTATSGGNVTAAGGGTVTARGVCWSTTANPTTANSLTSNGTGTGTFTSSLTGLIAGTLYHIRAYATNSGGTAYGTDLTFTTLPASIPTITTTAASTITATTATSGGNITVDGGASVTVRGVCWSTTANPTIALTTKTTDGTGTGIFTSSITGLTANTLYHIRAYATNNAGTAYGADLTFTTLVQAPTLTTTAASVITMNSANSGGNITSDGGANVTVRGICWSTTINPTTANSTTTDGNGTGIFTSSLTGLTANTLYHIRSYATNNAGTAYGNDVTFTTSAATSPTVTTTAASSIGTTAVVTGGNITSDGGSAITAKGVCWGPNQNPKINGNHTTDGLGTGVFTSNITGLSPGTTYHIRAYATNGVGNVYGADLTFTTASILVPSISTTTASTITTTTASSGGDISSDGGASVTVRGVCWSTTTNPTIALTTKTVDGTGTGIFSSSITGLTANTTYHVRAYATNSAGTAYGTDLTFTTAVALTVPAITTATTSAITSSTAVSGGNISNDGGTSVTARGVCWSTTTNPTTVDSKTIDGSGTGVFSSSLTGLIANTTYHIRAYATNSIGTSYGTDVVFTTSASLFAINGVIMYNNSTNSPMIGSTVNLVSGTNIVGTTTTDANGNYSFNNVANGIYTVDAATSIPWGGVTATDALKMKRHIASLEILTEPIRLTAADVNMFGSINATDVLKVQRRIASLDLSFTRPDWIFEIPVAGSNTITVSDANVTQNFFALCTGDVNGSYIPVLKTKNSTVSSDNSSSYKTNINDIFDLPVRVSQSTDIGAMQLFFNYPAEMIEIVGVSMNSNDELIYNADNGKLSIVWSSLNPLLLKANDAIITVKLKTKSSGSITFDLLNESEIADENGQIHYNVGLLFSTIEVSNLTSNIEQPSNKLKLSNYPNPFTKKTHIEYEIAEAGNVSLSVFDFLGKKVADLINTHQTAGKYNIVFDCESLPIGIYNYKLEFNNKSQHYQIRKQMSLIK